jgi:PKD repeat protein
LNPGTYAIVVVPDFEQPVFTCSDFNAYTVSLVAGEVQIAQIADVCDSNPAFDLFAIPSGGVWSGTGIVDAANGTFDPAVSGLGTFTVTYTATDNGCAGTATTEVTVVPAPPADFVGLASNYCVTAEPAALVGIPAGGTFFINSPNGVGMFGNLFDPSTVAPGTYEISYSVSIEGGCLATTSQTVEVIASPVVTFELPQTSICSQDAPIALSASPEGGIFSGAGVVGTTFDPSAVSPGVVSITYTFTDETSGCAGISIQDITVNPAPVVSITNLEATYCLSSDAVNLVGFPALGSFSGAGVTDGVFTAASAGLGTHVITYQIDNQTCVGSVQQTVEVTEDITVAITGVPATICSSDAAIQLQSTPSGAIFSGPGVFGNVFNAGFAGVGTHTLTATLNQGTCSATSTQQIVVEASPEASFNVSINGSAVTMVNTSSGATSFFWDFGDNTTSVDANPTHVYQANGTYIIALVASRPGCENDTFSVVIELSVGIGSIEGVDMLQLFPNPTNGLVNLKFNSLRNQSYVVSITDATGRLVRSEVMTDYVGAYNNVFDLSENAKGMYFFTIASERGTVNYKVVLQ